MKRLFLSSALFLLILQDQAAAWVLPAPTTSSSPCSFIRAPGGITAKVRASSGDDGASASGTGQGRPTHRKRKNRLPMPAAPSGSSNDQLPLAVAKMIVENNQVMLGIVDQRLEKALSKWLVIRRSLSIGVC